MKAAFYSGAAGLMAYQEAMDTIGNNIANVNTNGYKARTTLFYDLLYTDMYANTETNPLTGWGVKAVTSGIEPNQAPVTQSNGVLDFAVEGNGWFAVEKNGQIQYTRDGCFSIGLEGETAALVTADGGFVLDSLGQKITCNSANIADTFNPMTLSDRIGIYTFKNPQGLEPVSSNRYAPNEKSGEAVIARDGDYRIVSGFLEQSGISLTDEVCRMIMVQRAYQVSARLIQVADENEQTINNLRR